MKIEKKEITFYLPLFLVCLFGREYRGLGFETFIISVAIVVFLLRFWRIFLTKDIVLLSSFIVVIFGLIGSYLVSNIEEDFRFGLQDSLEDFYSVCVFFFFYAIGLSIDSNDEVFWAKFRNVVLVGLALNLLMCFLYYGDAWRFTYLQRLWNPYLLLLLVISHFASKTIVSLLWLVPFSLILFLFSTSFQMSAIFVLLIASVIFGNRIVGVLNYKFLGYGIIFSVLGLICFSLYIDPYILAGIDHNFGVRAVFWREALQEFVSSPWGFGFGVSVVSGDMSAINESAFQGGGELGDLGVHSGFMSILYKLGLFGLPVGILIFRSAFFLDSVDFEGRKGYLIVMLACYLSLFSNDAIFAPHFSAAIGFALGLYSFKRRRSARSSGFARAYTA